MLRQLAARCGSSLTNSSSSSLPAFLQQSEAAAGGGSSLRWLSASVQASTDAEKQIAAKIAAGLAGAQAIKVQDTSGGCGAMYSIEVVAPEFAGQSIVKQHLLVTSLLKEEIGQWHGFQLVTKAPPAA